MAKTNQKKKKNVKVDAAGEAHIQATFNNVIISLTKLINKKGANPFKKVGVFFLKKRKQLSRKLIDIATM